MSAARVICDQEDPDGSERDGAYVEFDYNPPLIEELKELVPGRDRRWLPYLKQWWVAEGHVEAVSSLLLEHYPEIEVVDEDGVVEYRDREGPTARQNDFFR